MNIKQTINSFSAWTVDRLTSARRATLTMLATFLIAMTAQTAWAQNPESIGTIRYNSELGAYEINSVYNLNDLAVYVNGSGQYASTVSEDTPHNCENLTFKMTADITFNTTVENNFTPIGKLNDGFHGTFDGQGHTISGIRIKKPGDDYLGVFGNLGNTTSGAVVKNLVVRDCSIEGDDHVGGIAGYLKGGEIGTGIIENCHVGDDVTLKGYLFIGGIAGISIKGTIKGCTCAATIKGANSGGNNAYKLGGITGDISSSTTLTNNIFTGTISGDLQKNIGAIVGNNENGGLDKLDNNVYTSTGFHGIGAESSSTAGTDPDVAKLAYSITAGENVTVDFAGNAATVYSPNGISVYTGAGMKYADVLYVGGTAAVNLSLGSDSDDPILSYSATKGTLSGTATTGSNDAYTLTMANEASIITATIALWGEEKGYDGTTEEKAFVINNTAGLDLLAQMVNAGNGYSGKYFKLDADIEYDKTTTNNFTPIGNDDKCFEGIFDGNGKTISGLNINLTTDNVGLFGNVTNATIKGVKLDNSTIKGGNRVGGIVGAGDTSTTTVENCAVTSNVTVSGTHFIGGIVGQWAIVRGCISAAAVSGIQYVGGIVGNGDGATIERCIYTGSSVTASAGSYKGAITGSNDSATLTANYYTQATIGGCNGSDVDGARKAVAIGAAEGVTITPKGDATDYKVSGITTYDDIDDHILGYDSKLYAGATEAVKLSIGYTVPEGYKFIKINAGEKVTVTASGDDYVMMLASDVTSDVTVGVDFEAIKYTLKYEGVDEAVFENANPTEYTIESETFTLSNPSREGYLFMGWTYGGQTTPTTSVTIATGSTGDKTFTANWRSMEEPNTAVVNVEETPVAIGGEVYYQPTEEIKGKMNGKFDATVSLSAGASNRVEVTPEGDLRISKGPSTTIAMLDLKFGDIIKLIFRGLIHADADQLIHINYIYNKHFTRGRGDSSSDGMIDLVSGAEYEVLTDDPLVLTIVLEEEEAVLEGISVTEPEPSDGSIVVTAKNKYWTFSSDKDVKVPAGVKVYTCQLNSDQTAVVITNITSTLGGVIKAGNGVLLSSAPGDYTFVPSTETASETKTYENNLLEPVLKATNFASGEYYVLKDNEFHPILANDSNVPANKAVLRVAKKSAARLEIIGDDDVKTAINGIAVEEDGAEWYTISGQRIDKPTKKGLYIKNGKKVIIK